MQLISQTELDTDLSYRIRYLRDFISFTNEDAATLHAAAPVVSPLVPVVVNAVYEKLLSFDVTAKSFVPRQTGYSGDAPTKLEDLSQDHPQIKFRKDFLARYLVKVVSMDYEKEESWKYLDNVGLMHTGEAGFKHR
jgi:Protoglobin